MLKHRQDIELGDREEEGWEPAGSPAGEGAAKKETHPSLVFAVILFSSSSLLEVHL